MRGIILAGGSGTRLSPMTKVVNKQLLPVYDKPLIYYPLASLMLAGIREILIISSAEYLSCFRALLGSGAAIGMNFEYAVQSKPIGLVDAFCVGEDFIGDESVALALGDNVFYGQHFSGLLLDARSQIERDGGAVIFGYPVKDPRSFGVVEFDENKRVVGIEEKPDVPKSNYAVPGLYFYDNQVCELAKAVKPSARGELEITTLNSEYLRRNQLYVQLMGRGMAWLDTGTPESLLQAAEFIEAVQSRQGFYVACIEEIAYRLGYIGQEALLSLGSKMGKTAYGQYLVSLADCSSSELGE